MLPPTAYSACIRRPRAAASLKRSCFCPIGRRALGIRRPRAAASLKLCSASLRVCTWLLYPPPAGGGLIEARIRYQMLYRYDGYPPPAGGGLIEAFTPACCSRGYQAYPPPAGGGLIEARSRRRRYGDSGTYPPPAGGGLIEARTTRGMSTPWPRRIRRPRAAASLKRGRSGKPLRKGGKYPPPAGGGLIEASAALSVRRYRLVVSAARGRRPH